LLAALLAAPQRILTRDQLLEASRVYDNEVYDRPSTFKCCDWRRKIETDPSQPQFILTERGVGYLFRRAGGNPSLTVPMPATCGARLGPF